MKKSVKNKYILLLLTILFMAPGITAYLFYHHPDWLGSTKTNKGTLLNPPLKLNSLVKQEKWQLILWNKGACKTSCLKQLEQLARIRLALGRRLYNVDQRLILKEEYKANMKQSLAQFLKKQDFQVSSISQDEASLLKNHAPHMRIFIANPDNLLILAYKNESNSNDIYQDLKHLLTLSEQKNG